MPEAAMIAEWLAKDELHQQNGWTIDDVFEDGTDTVLVYDGEGPLIAIRLHKALRVAMQFRPESRLRIARIGAEVTKWLQNTAKKAKCNEVIIRPGGKAVKFAKRLGFRDFIGKFLGV